MAPKGTQGFQLSVDIDVVDPRYAPGVSTPVRDWVSRDEAVEALRLLGRTNILSADFVELNPLRD